MENRDCAEAVIWGEKAIPLAERFEDTQTLVRVCNYMGCAMMVIDYERGRELMLSAASPSRAEPTCHFLLVVCLPIWDGC